MRTELVRIISTAFFLCLTMLCKEAGAQQLLSDISDDLSDEIYNMEIEDLMEVDIRTGKPGWFGAQLEQLRFEPYVHGYSDVVYKDYDLNRGRSVDTFDMHYFNIIVGTDINDKIAAEILLEYEHGGDDTGVRYGIIDYKINDSTILRMGKFLVPMGRFNEYLSPEYANKLPDRPKCLWNIVPIVWAETGVQLRGEYEMPCERSFNYALYIVNGLEQEANTDGSVADGGDIRSMRQNNRDSNNSDKAVGGRIGYKPCEELEIGVSYYTGAYTIDGKQNLSIMDVDAEYKKRKLTVRGEFVQAWQEASGPNLKKDGFYAETAYRVNPKFEPVVRYDQASLDDGTGHDIKRSTVGFIYYPNPELNPMFNFRISQSFVHDDGTGDSKHEFVAQCVIGF